MALGGSRASSAHDRASAPAYMIKAREQSSRFPQVLEKCPMQAVFFAVGCGTIR